MKADDGTNTSEIVVSTAKRQFSDHAWAILFYNIMGSFISLLIYGITTGDLLSLVSVYNGGGLRCNENAGSYCIYDCS